MNNAKNTIESLRGEIQTLDTMTNEFKDCTLYDETGHVDFELMEDTIVLMKEFTLVSIRFNKAIQTLFGITEDDSPKNSKGKRGGCKREPEDVLRELTLDDKGIVHLPNVQLDAKTYDKVKQYITEAGGNWVGGKTQGFSFPFNPERVFAILKTGKRCNLAQEFQFFATPSTIADRLVALNTAISTAECVLEPSAGTGALLEAIWRKYPDKKVEYFELMPENKDRLAQMQGPMEFLGEDFLQCDGTRRWQAIIANPPFSGNQDVKHVMRMYEALERGGCVTAVMSNHWTFAEEKICKDFRQLLETQDALIESVPSGAFSKSGTSISTTIVRLIKP